MEHWITLPTISNASHASSSSSSTDSTDKKAILRLEKKVLDMEQRVAAGSRSPRRAVPTAGKSDRLASADVPQQGKGKGKKNEKGKRQGFEERQQFW